MSPLDRVCVVCGGHFTLTARQIRKPGAGTCCSRPCAQIWAGRARGRQLKGGGPSHPGFVHGRSHHTAYLTAVKHTHWRRHPERLAARRAVHNALRRGELQRQACAHCGDLRTQAHHHDYARPLDVTWLCQACHTAEHRSLAHREGEGLSHGHI